MTTINAESAEVAEKSFGKILCVLCGLCVVRRVRSSGSPKRSTSMRAAFRRYRGGAGGRAVTSGRSDIVQVSGSDTGLKQILSSHA
jgi:hypothetical protein